MLHWQHESIYKNININYWRRRINRSDEPIHTTKWLITLNNYDVIPFEKRKIFCDKYIHIWQRTFAAQSSCQINKWQGNAMIWVHMGWGKPHIQPTLVICPSYGFKLCDTNPRLMGWVRFDTIYHMLLLVRRKNQTI